ncbi:MAG: glycine zipper domain-containing protein [Candidatus Binatia bacterium]
MNISRTTGRLFLCLAFLMFVTVSCGTAREYVRENPRTAIGAGVGAAGGALIGGLVFDSAGAAVAGGLLGGLAGGLVGRALESKNEDYASTARDYNYRDSEGTVLRIEDVDADPARVYPRDRIHLVTRYALLPANRNQELTVTERWRITHNGRVVGDPVLKTTRTGGTWSSAIPLTLPADAASGVYRATVEIQTAGASDRGSTTFRVS